MYLDPYDNGTHGEDGINAEREATVCGDCGRAECTCITYLDGTKEVIDDRGLIVPTTSLVTTKMVVNAAIGVLCAFAFAGLFAACWLMDNSELAWRAN
jgi:hypothetical protein